MFDFSPFALPCAIILIWFLAKRNTKNKKLYEISQKLLNAQEVDLKNYKGISEKDIIKAFGDSIEIIKEDNTKSTKENLKEYKDTLIKQALKERKFNA